MKCASTLVAGVILALSIAAAAQRVAFASVSTECTVVALQAKAPNGTTITGASPVSPSGSLPQYCQVDGHVATPGNTVNFRLGLPANWNGKYYFVGVGGLGGTIGSLNAGLVRGYASASPHGSGGTLVARTRPPYIWTPRSLRGAIGRERWRWRSGSRSTASPCGSTSRLSVPWRRMPNEHRKKLFLSLPIRSVFGLIEAPTFEEGFREVIEVTDVAGDA